ncbi:protein of unknown function [Caballeronia arationis]|uniref:DUF3331 domain-containing protein n=1 Tax=Caballeronia arationis TaxID=1777142 RepID=A0A7Z7I7A6_9BURK|nr:DUF3331 domain-containing protein [Caballeronia arationis]SOE80610.1 protein of unknown function [Caballeronia arationis]
MRAELFPPVGRAASQASPEEGARNAITCITEALLGLRSQSNHAVSPPTRRLPKFRACDCTAAAVANEQVKQVTGPTRFQIVERLSRETLSVYWSDARTGLYADQLWRLGRSRIRSFCVLTGVAIQVGDLVYRPKSHSTGNPANRDFMILAGMVHDELSDVS